MLSYQRFRGLKIHKQYKCFLKSITTGTNVSTGKPTGTIQTGIPETLSADRRGTRERVVWIGNKRTFETDTFCGNVGNEPRGV